MGVDIRWFLDLKPNAIDRLQELEIFEALGFDNFFKCYRFEFTGWDLIEGFEDYIEKHPNTHHAFTLNYYSGGISHFDSTMRSRVLYVDPDEDYAVNWAADMVRKIHRLLEPYCYHMLLKSDQYDHDAYACITEADEREDQFQQMLGLYPRTL